MFRYSDTNEVSKPRELQNKIVTVVRKVTYLSDNPNPKVSEPVITEGFEPVREAVVSPGYTCQPEIIGVKTVDNRKRRSDEQDRIVRR